MSDHSQQVSFEFVGDSDDKGFEVCYRCEMYKTKREDVDVGVGDPSAVAIPSSSTDISFSVKLTKPMATRSQLVCDG